MARLQSSRPTSHSTARAPQRAPAWWNIPRNAATGFVAMHRPVTFALSLVWSLLCFAVSALFSLTHLPPPTAPAICASVSSPELHSRARPRRRPPPTPILTLSPAALASLEQASHDFPSSPISTPTTSSTTVAPFAVERSTAAATLHSNRIGLLFRQRPRRAGSLAVDAFDRHVLGDVEESEEDYHNRLSQDHSDRYSLSSDHTFDTEDGSDHASHGSGSLTSDGGASDPSEEEKPANQAETLGSSSHTKRSNNPMHWFRRRSSTKGNRRPRSCKDCVGDVDEQGLPSKGTFSPCKHPVVPFLPSLRLSERHPDSVSFLETGSHSSELHVDSLGARTDSTLVTTSSTLSSATSNETGPQTISALPSANTRRRGLSHLFRRSPSPRSRSPSSKPPLGSPSNTPPISPTMIPSIHSSRKTDLGLASLDSDVPILHSSMAVATGSNQTSLLSCSPVSLRLRYTSRGPSVDRMPAGEAAISFRYGAEAYLAGSYEASIELFTAAIAQDENSPKLYDARAKAFDKAGRPRDALKDAKRVIELLPESTRGYELASRLLKGTGMFAQAQKMLVVALTKCPTGSKLVLAIKEELKQVRELANKLDVPSAITNLPAELLVHIVAMVCNLEATKPSPNPTNPAIVASRVCHQWRTVVNDAPMLWNSLHLDCEKWGTQTVRKTKYWAARSTGRIPDGPNEASLSLGKRRGHGIASLTLLALDHITPANLARILATFDEYDAAPTLVNFACTWKKPSRSDQAQAQLNRLIHYLVKNSAKSLRSLLLHTPSTMLKIGFSLPRFCHTFTALEEINLRGTRGDNIIILEVASHLLPLYADEVEWSPTPIRTLISDQVAWELRFLTPGTATPECIPTDFPHLARLEYTGLPAPGEAWHLFPTPGLRHLKICGSTSVRPPDESSVDLERAFVSLESLTLLSTRGFGLWLLNLMTVQNKTYDALRSVRISPLTVSTSILSLFGGDVAPQLEVLRLASSNANELYPVDLPTSFPKLKQLELSNSAWVKNEHLVSLANSAPLLKGLRLDHIENKISRGVMEVVKKRWEGLNELDLTGCSGIEVDAVEWVRQFWPQGRQVVKFSFSVHNDKNGGRKAWRQSGT
ncbi:BQ2448_5297 [Microbotryum intermedium]|uniref:BQ2448_5297 protein n=1 Tax=Microbotryum intermedium TaxID=269621 RepID=A0A238F9D8_9BASI|nr:BQ2448_5297 [Microbotryum intermedium]